MISLSNSSASKAVQDKLNTFISRLNSDERKALAAWIEKILEVKELETTKSHKAKALLQILKESKPLYPLIRETASVAKEVGWDNRKGGSRAFLAGAGVGIAFFGFQGAGLAALGGAVGFPLWVVFGGGGTLAYTILAEIRSSKSNDDPEKLKDI